MNVSRGIDGLTVLYVGSDTRQTAFIETYLADLGEAATGLTAETVAEAERIAERERLTCVVAQYDLPDGDGLTALSRCLALQSELLTILVSEDDDPSLIDRTYEAGVDEFVHYTGPEKRRVVEHYLSTYLGRDESAAGHPRTSRHMETLAATTSDAIVSVDESSVIRYANPAVADVFGYEPAEVIGKPLTMLMPEDLADRHRAGIREYLASGERTLDWDDIELPGRHKEGHEVPLSISFSEFTVGDEHYFTGIVRDIRERKRLQAERDLYHEATQRILQAESFEEGLRIALAAVGDAMDWRYGEAWIRPDDGCIERVPGPYVTSRADEAFADATASVAFEADEGIVGRVWESGTPEWLTDIAAADAPFPRSAAAAEAGLRAALAVPIVSDGRVVAVMAFFLAETREPDQAMIDATTTIAADLGRLMERLEAETALREERSLNDRILETSPVGIAILEEDGVFSYLNDRAAEILGAGEYDEPLRYEDLGLELVTFDGEPVAAGDRPYRRVVAAGNVVSGELRVLVDGEQRWLSVEGAPLQREDEAVTSTVFSLQDVTQRKERERRLLQHDAAMNTVSDGLYALDEEGRYVVVNDAYADLVGYSREELLGRPATDVIDERIIDQAAELQRRIRADGSEEATLEAVITTASGDQVPIETRISLFELEGGNYGRAGVVRDISERKRREERLARLNEVGQALTTAETSEDVATIVVEGAQEILGHPLTTVEYYDETAGELRPGARTPELEELVGSAPLFGTEWDLTWRVFAENEGAVVDDLGEEAGVEADQTPLASAIVLPIDGHGVFVVGTPTPRPFSDTDVMVARILVANTVAALDRVDREQELRAQKSRLEEHTDALERLNRLNGVIRGLTQQLVEASTREEIEAAVCEELVGTDPYVFAWVGEPEAVGDEVTPRANAGREEGYLDAIAVTVDDGPTGQGPAGVALKSNEPVVQNNLQVDPPFEPWRTQALQRGYRACIAVPLAYRETVYGVLSLYAGAPGVFDEMEVAVLDELGGMIGYAINAIERRKALVGDSAVELTFTLDDASIPAVEFAKETTGTFEFETFVEQRDGTLRVFFETTGVDPETVYEFGDRSPTVQHLSLLTERDDGCRFEVVVSESDFLAELVSYGAYPTAMRADAGGGKLTVELPQNGDVRAFIRMFVRRYEGAELAARVDKSRPVRTSAEFEATYRNRLTERQTEVLKTAYFSGFFEWPRETSGKELASLLGISQPTVSRHIRTSERKLFGLLFDDD